MTWHGLAWMVLRTWRLELLTLSYVMLRWMLLRLLLLLLLMGRSLLLWHILTRVDRIPKLLTLWMTGLLDLVGILNSTSGRDLRLHRLLEPRRFGHQDDIYTYELTLSTVD